MLYTFFKVLTRRICLTIKSFFGHWSFPLFSLPKYLIQGWYCEEKLDASHSLFLYIPEIAAYVLNDIWMLTVLHHGNFLLNQFKIITWKNQNKKNSLWCLPLYVRIFQNCKVLSRTVYLVQLAEKQMEVKWQMLLSLKVSPGQENIFSSRHDLWTLCSSQILFCPALTLSQWVHVFFNRRSIKKLFNIS